MTFFDGDYRENGIAGQGKRNHNNVILGWREVNPFNGVGLFSIDLQYRNPYAQILIKRIPAKSTNKYRRIKR